MHVKASAYDARYLLKVTKHYTLMTVYSGTGSLLHVTPVHFKQISQGLRKVSLKQQLGSAFRKW